MDLEEKKKGDEGDEGSRAAKSGIESAVGESEAYRGGPPTHRIAYRSILLDRTLRNLGIHEDDPAPPVVLQEFEAKTRRRMDLHYRQAHVCQNCARWYERLSRQRAAELDTNNSPLMPLLRQSATAPAIGRTLPRVDEAYSGGDEAVEAGAPAGGSARDAADSQPLASAKSVVGLLPSSYGSSVAPASLARAMMRTSASLPALHDPKRPIPPMPVPKRRGSNSRITRIVAVN